MAFMVSTVLREQDNVTKLLRVCVCIKRLLQNEEGKNEAVVAAEGD